MRNLMKALCCYVLIATAGCGADDETVSVKSTAITDYGGAPLHLTWMKASHNTYEGSHTPGSTIAWHLGNTTNHVELDLRDTHAYGTLSGNWTVAHGYNAGEQTTRCGGGITFSACLAVLQQYHRANPNHPLITVWLDKKQDWQNMNISNSSRSPWRIDSLIVSYFNDWEVFKPADWAPAGYLRTTVKTYGWPAHASLAGKLMFIMTSDAGCSGNDRLEAYAKNRGLDAKVFIAPSGESWNAVASAPQCFDSVSTQFAAIYNFEWEDSNNDGECDGSTCAQVPTAHDRRFLARVWDIDDSVEFDAASARPRGGGYGHANFIAIDRPWQMGGDGGYGWYPDGTYPW